MKLSKKDVMFLSLKLTIVISLLFTIGFFYGSLVMWAFYSLNHLIMKEVFGLEAVSPVDTLLVHDDNKNVANIVSKLHLLSTIIGAVVFPKFEPEAMRQHLYKKVELIFRAKSRLVKIFGKYYYKAMAEEDFKAKFSKFF